MKVLIVAGHITFLILLTSAAFDFAISSDLDSNQFFSARVKLNQELPKKTAGIDKWFGKDKFDHFLVSAFLVNYSYIQFRDRTTWSYSRSVQSSVTISLGIGIGKEIWDKFSKKGVCSYRDLAADILGIGVGFYICSQVK